LAEATPLALLLDLQLVTQPTQLWLETLLLLHQPVLAMLHRQLVLQEKLMPMTETLV